MVIAARAVQLLTAAQDGAVCQVQPQVVAQLALTALPATRRDLVTQQRYGDDNEVVYIESYFIQGIWGENYNRSKLLLDSASQVVVIKVIHSQ